MVGDFEGGELNDSPEARERQALIEEEEAAEALREQQERAERGEEDEATARARALQSEGAGEEGVEESAPRGRQSEPEEGEEKVIDGVRHYATVVRGQLRWLTLKQLREQANVAAGAEQAVQDAQEAVKRASQIAARPPEPSVEFPSDEELAEVITAANMGDEEAVKKLALLIKQGSRPQTQVDVRSVVSEQIATQRAIDQAERAQKDLINHPSLGDVFRLRLRKLSQEKPTMMIVDAYREVGDQMRSEFAPMIGKSAAPASKQERKRTLVTPPSAAGRQRQERAEEEEESVSSVIDQLAKSRGQQRAIRQRRI